MRLPTHIPLGRVALAEIERYGSCLADPIPIHIIMVLNLTVYTSIFT